MRFPGPTHLVLLARTEAEAKQAWERLQSQFAALRLMVNQEKSRLTTAAEGVPTYPGSGARSSTVVSW